MTFKKIILYFLMKIFLPSLPMPSIPNPTVAGGYLKDAFIIGIVAFTQSVSMAKILARKNNYSIDPNQVLAYTRLSIHVTPHKNEIKVYYWYLTSKEM